MKNLSIIFICALAALASCTKSKEVHPELGDGNEEFLTVGLTTARVEYTRADMAELQKVVFHYCLSGVQQFTAAEMTKREYFFELTLNDLVSDTLYYYYYEVFPNSGNASTIGRKIFHTLAVDSPIPPTPPVAELPAVVTAEVSEISNNSAVCGGEVTNDGGSEVTERGVCWSTNENPTVNDNHVAVGEGIGAFTETINGLETNTIYHVRAYATNEKGTAYGLDKEFTTLSGGGGGSGDAPIGAINGLFSVSVTTQVYFSQGNLQYQASTNTWRFAEHQWDYVGTQTPEFGALGGTVPGSDNNLISSTYNGWIDLFGWSTSGYNHGAVCYQPWSTSTNVANYYAYGFDSYNLNDQTGQADWGYNTISNGGNQTGQWHTLTKDEWEYVFNGRTTTSGIRYAKAYVNYVNGVILLPDNWSSSYYGLSSPNNYSEDFANNVISLLQWTTLERYGAVFLPAAGSREETLASDVGSYGRYWSSSFNFSYYAYELNFGSWFLDPETSGYRNSGNSVRLVRLAE